VERRGGLCDSGRAGVLGHGTELRVSGAGPASGMHGSWRGQTEVRSGALCAQPAQQLPAVWLAPKLVLTVLHFYGN